jgi:OTU domain-containing protein 5
MAVSRSHFAPFVDGEDFDAYLERKRRPWTHGNHLEIEAMSEIYNRPFEVYSPAGGLEPLNIFQGSYRSGNPPVRLLYSGGNHYDALADPRAPSVGVGLGLPGLGQGQQVAPLRAALGQSEAMLLEQQMLESIRFTTDQQMTEKEMERLMIEESRREYYNSFSSRPSVKPPAAAPSSSSSSASRQPGASASGTTVTAPAAAATQTQTTADSLDVDPSGEWAEGVKALVAMGFDPTEAVQAFSIFGDDIESSITFLTNRSP